MFTALILRIHLLLPLKLKVEINSREHFTVYGFNEVPFTVSARWFEGSCKIKMYELNELLGTKLRALYQRKKGRDLFDLAIALERPEVDPSRVLESFTSYMDHEGRRVTRAQFEQNMDGKLRDPQFSADIGPLLADGFAWNLDRAAKSVLTGLIERLPGDPWRGKD